MEKVKEAEGIEDERGIRAGNKERGAVKAGFKPKELVDYTQTLGFTNRTKAQPRGEQAKKVI